MNPTSNLVNQQQVAEAFSRQAPVFDTIYSGDTITMYKRQRVRDHVLQFLPANSQILELNAGTGEDALFFAGLGHSVHATDISDQMQEELSSKVIKAGMNANVSWELRSFTDLNKLEEPGPYDFVFSNFAGLNCSSELARVLQSLETVLKPGGYVTLVLLPKFCLWEFCLLFKGKFKTAFRRFAGKEGARANVEGLDFRCWYYNPSFVRKQLRNSFELVKLEGLCSLVPPSYISGFEEKWPKLFSFLKKREQSWKDRWPWRSIGDYYIITLQRKH